MACRLEFADPCFEEKFACSSAEGRRVMTEEWECLRGNITLNTEAGVPMLGRGQHSRAVQSLGKYRISLQGGMKGRTETQGPTLEE